MNPPGVARVAFNARVNRLFDYRVPAGAPADLVGRRASAPFGRRAAVGVIMEVAPVAAVAEDKLKTLARVYDDMPPLPPQTLALIRFCADYYHCPIGVAAAATLPAFFRRANHFRPPTGYRLCPAAAERFSPGRSRSAPALLAALRKNGAQPLAALREVVPNPQPALKNLLAAGAVERCHLWEALPPGDGAPAAAPPPLTPAQQTALDGLRLNSGFAPHLLFGATGAGKTEIYLRATAATLAAGGRALILTPEIHLTPQLEGEFRRRFPDRRLCVLHSGLADGERAHRWLMARLGAADIVIGARSAALAPLPRLGLIVVDEEHDDSYKQEDGMLFSARDVAVWRAKREAAAFIAGSATPSLESYANARRGKWALLTLPKRVVGVAPAFQIVAIGEGETLYHGMGQTFLRALADCLRQGKQALVFINRRGYSPGLLCRQCRTILPCRRCSANMTAHRRRGVLCCHLCGLTLPLPPVCGVCGGALTPFGVGAQRVEEALARLFPDVPLLRLDSDALSGGEFAEARAGMESGEWRLLVGTKLIAKGHNFPKLALIGVLSADTALAAGDFRAEERLFALLSQVAGRGTRNPEGCRVLLQTRHPAHPFHAELAADNVEGCWRRLLRDRRRAGLPPFSHLALLRARHRQGAALEKFMEKALAAARPPPAGEVRIFGAAPPPVEIIGGWRRLQALVIAARRPPLRRFLADWIPRIPKTGANWRIDVDPMEI